MKRIFLSVLAGMSGAALSVALLGGGASAGLTQQSETLTGVALIESLDLRTLGSEDDTCTWGMDFEGTVYCLDSAATTRAEARLLAGQIRGVIPNEDLRRLIEAQETLAAAHEELGDAIESGDTARIAEAEERALEARQALLSK